MAVCLSFFCHLCWKEPLSEACSWDTFKASAMLVIFPARFPLCVFWLKQADKCDWVRVQETCSTPEISRHWIWSWETQYALPTDCVPSDSLGRCVMKPVASEVQGLGAAFCPPQRASGQCSQGENQVHQNPAYPKSTYMPERWPIRDYGQGPVQLGSCPISMINVLFFHDSIHKDLSFAWR